MTVPHTHNQGLAPRRKRPKQRSALARAPEAHAVTPHGCKPELQVERPFSGAWKARMGQPRATPSSLPTSPVVGLDAWSLRFSWALPAEKAASCRRTPRRAKRPRRHRRPLVGSASCGLPLDALGVPRAGERPGSTMPLCSSAQPPNRPNSRPLGCLPDSRAKIRALPWAILCRPVGAVESTCNCGPHPSRGSRGFGRLTQCACTDKLYA